MPRFGKVRRFRPKFSGRRRSRYKRSSIAKLFPKENKYTDLAAQTSLEFALNTAHFLADLGAGAPYNACQICIPAAQGTSVTNFIGKKYAWTSIQIRGIVSVGTTLISSGQMDLVWDREPNKAAPVLGDIYTSPNPTAGFRNRDQTGRYKVVKSWQFNFQGSTTVPTAASSAFIDETIKLNPRKYVTELTVGATTGAYGNIIKGAFYIVCRGTAATGATAPTIQFVARGDFTDQ